MLPVIALAAVSLAAFAFAAYVAYGMVRDKAAMRDRIARATRPVHGAPMGERPAIVRNRLGED